MPANEYQFVTRWRVEATPEEVFRILEDNTSLPRWWPDVWLDVQELEPPVNGRGGRFRMHSRGWLPYTLRWDLHPTEKDPSRRLALEATGDFVGVGVWTLTADGPFTDVVYDWRIRADKPLLKYLSFLMKPLFRWNHRWAMARGEESLKRELKRRREERR